MRKSDATISANFRLIAALVLLWPGHWLVHSSGLLDDYIVRILMLIGIRITAAVSLQLINGISGQFSLGHAGFMAIGAYIAAYPAITYSRHLTQPISSVAFYLAVGAVVAVAGVAAYAIYRLMRISGRLFAVAPAILTIAIAFWIVIDLSLAATHQSPYLIWSWAVEALGNLYAATLAALAPVGEQLSSRLPASVAIPLAYVIHLVAGGLAAAAAGLLVGFPALRLRGDYLAIATLGFAEIIRVLLQSSPTLGGALGMTGIPKVTGFAWIYGIAILTIAAIWRLAHSARGRAMLAVREDEIAAAAVGINPAGSKVLAFATGAFFAGIAGATFAQYEGSVSPANFDFMASIELVVIVTLAGTGSISGTVLMAAILTWLPEQLRLLSEYRMIIYSLVLILMMLARPNGLLGGRELLPSLGRRRHATA